MHLVKSAFLEINQLLKEIQCSKIFPACHQSYNIRLQLCIACILQMRLSQPQNVLNNTLTRCVHALMYDFTCIWRLCRDLLSARIKRFGFAALRFSFPFFLEVYDVPLLLYLCPAFWQLHINWLFRFISHPCSPKARCTA